MKKLIVLFMMTMLFAATLGIAMSRGERDVNNTDASSRAGTDSNDVYGYEPNDANSRGDMNTPGRTGTGTGVDRQQGTPGRESPSYPGSGATTPGESGSGTGSGGMGGSSGSDSSTGSSTEGSSGSSGSGE
ncbi:MAG: hypothetical protein A2Y12_12745 [Planctomycetes bacterium GWF2_42_9]|nr:MAG: hypothetical protein A2Y12_12745 [Planctomycetes bacterium GWF2_42_9]